MRRARLRTLIAAGLALALAGASACGGSSSPAGPSASTYVLSAAELSDILSEKVMGSASATVTLIDYSSLTCPHCATFHLSTLPQIKAAYIDTGKVKLVYRDFSVAGASTTAAAYAAAALARCAGSAKYFDALDALYRSQASWTGASDVYSAMKQAVASLGMASDKMDACMGSTDIQNGINQVMATARASYAVSGTPTFVINGQTIVGAASFAEFDAILKTLVK
jgi:protein-disulfide isomerase